MTLQMIAAPADRAARALCRAAAELAEEMADQPEGSRFARLDRRLNARPGREPSADWVDAMCPFVTMRTGEERSFLEMVEEAPDLSPYDDEAAVRLAKLLLRALPWDEPAADRLPAPAPPLQPRCIRPRKNLRPRSSRAV